MPGNPPPGPAEARQDPEDAAALGGPIPFPTWEAAETGENTPAGVTALPLRRGNSPVRRRTALLELENTPAVQEGSGLPNWNTAEKKWDAAVSRGNTTKGTAVFPLGTAASPLGLAVFPV